MPPEARRSAALDLGTGALLAAAIAVIAESRGHVVGLVLRTVREAGDGGGAPRGRRRGAVARTPRRTGTRRNVPAWRLLVLPAAVAAVVLVAARQEALDVAARATPALTMAERQATLALAWVRTAALLALGALAASWLLVAGALVVASRARPERDGSLGGRRVAVLAAGIAGIALVALFVAQRGRAVAWAGASAAAAGVLAVFRAAPAGSSADAPQRRACEAGVCGAAVLSLAAVGCAAMARALVAAVGLGDEGPGDWPALVAMMRGRMIAEGGATLWFVAPVLLASLIAVGPAALARGLAGARVATACACAALVAVLFAPSLLDRPAAALAAFSPTLTPAGFVAPPTSLEGDCAAMEEARVVFLGADRVHVGAVDEGPAAALDAPAACDAFVAAHVAEAPTPWVSFEASAPFGRAECLLGALGRARGESVSPGTSGRIPRQAYGGREPPCSVYLVARSPDGASPRCPRLVLTHPYCWGYRPDPGNAVEPEMLFEVVMADPAGFRIRISRGAYLVTAVQAPRRLVRDGSGRAAFPELEALLRQHWRSRGEHSSPADRKVDFAALRADPATPLPEVIAALEAMSAPHRDMSLPGVGVGSVPVFDVGLAPLAPPRSRPVVAELADGPGAPRVEIVPRTRGESAPAEAAVVDHLGALRACAAGAAELPPLAELSFRVDAEGFADSPRLVGLAVEAGKPAKPVDRDLASCVGRAIESTPFDGAPARGHTLSLRFAPPR